MFNHEICKDHTEAYFEEAFRQAVNIGIDEEITNVLADLAKNLGGAPVDSMLFAKALETYRKHLTQQKKYEDFLQEMVWQTTTYHGETK